MQLSPRAALYETVELEEALARLDAGEYDEARVVAGKLFAHSGEQPEAVTGALYVFGAALVHDAMETDVPEQRRRLYLMAIRYLEEAHARGFPESRRESGLDLLARSLFEAGYYAKSLPVLSAPDGPDTPLLTLGEGATPLVPVPALGAAIGARNLWLKVEGANPTGSFKDRGMVVAVAKALESGARAIVCASTGNTSASAAAYAAAAGIEAIVLIPAGKIAAGKLLQAFAAGAKVIAIDGNFDAALEIVRDLGAAGGGVEIVNSINPHRIAGQATAAHEIAKLPLSQGKGKG